MSNWYDGWRVVSSGGTDYIGHVAGEDGDIVTMDVVYLFGTQMIHVDPQGRICPPGVQGHSTRINYMTQLCDLMASMPTTDLRWTRRRWVADYDDADRERFRMAIAQAEEMRKKLSAARSGLALATAMPERQPTSQRRH